MFCVAATYGCRACALQLLAPEPLPTTCRDTPVRRRSIARFPADYGTTRLSGTRARNQERLLHRLSPRLPLRIMRCDKVGAQASANLFTLVMTCRANEVDRFEYLSYRLAISPGGRAGLTRSDMDG